MFDEYDDHAEENDGHGDDDEDYYGAAAADSYATADDDYDVAGLTIKTNPWSPSLHCRWHVVHRY